MQTRVAVIFDMDGVLVDSAEAHRLAWQQLGLEVGTPFTTALFQQTFGQRNASIIPVWLGPAASVISMDRSRWSLGASQSDRLLGTGGTLELTPERIDALAARKETLYRELVRHGAIRVYPGVSPLLRELRALGARVAVASSGPRENVSLVLDSIGVQGTFDATVTSEDVVEGKPHPEVFLKAAGRLGVAPVSCAVIEDAVHGIEAAKRAGMLAVAVLTSTARAVLLAAGADLIVDDVGALHAGELVSRLAARGA